MGRLGKQVQKVMQKLRLGTIYHNGKKYMRLKNENLVPSDVPVGFLVVYVGVERRRFVVEAELLKYFMFQVLLAKSAEEFGHKYEGGLIIACDVAFFEHLLWLIDSKSPFLYRMPDCSTFTWHNNTSYMME